MDMERIEVRPIEVETIDFMLNSRSAMTPGGGEGGVSVGC